MKNPIHIKRIYDELAETDGYRILVDRLWPRGVKKEDAYLDEWDKDVAPSTEIRKEFNHQDDRFAQFTKEYKKELAGKKEALQHILEINQKYPVTLLYAARSRTINHAIVLQEVLQKQKK